MSKFKPSQLVYIVVSNRYIQPVTIQRQDDNKYLVKLERAGEMWVDESRLFANREAAEMSLQQFELEHPRLLSYIDKLKSRHERL